MDKKQKLVLMFLDFDGTFSPYPPGSLSGTKKDHFVNNEADNKIDFKIDKQTNDGLKCDYSSDLVEYLVQIIKKYNIQLCWLSSWEPDLLSDVIFDSEPELYKLSNFDFCAPESKLKLIESISVDTKSIWCDDDIVEKKIKRGNILLVKPKSDRGINRRDIKQIEEFCKL